MDVLVESARGYLELTGRRVLGKMTDSLRPGGGESSRSLSFSQLTLSLLWYGLLVASMTAVCAVVGSVICRSLPGPALSRLLSFVAEAWDFVD